MGIVSDSLKANIKKFKMRKFNLDMNELYNVARQTEEAKKSIKTLDQLTDYHPIHAVYIATQNLVSLLSEHLSILPEFNEYYEIVGKADEEYMPQSPPMSPLTRSYFTMWAFFDVRFGKDKETMGTCLQDIGADLGMSDGNLEVIKLMQDSRMGLYEHQGYDGKYVYLQELFTNQKHKCLVPAGYYGQEKELWYVRVLPAPFVVLDVSLVFTTPYLLISPDKSRWMDYIERTVVKTRIDNSILAYETLMKYGLSENYWNEFIFLAYYNHTSNVIFLAGLPDIPESLPHSEFYRDLSIKGKIKSNLGIEENE